MSVLKGHDVSKWQGSNPPDGDFLIAKGTQGVTETDRGYATHRSTALHAGKLFGSYHYADGADPVGEAKFYVKHTPRSAGELMALDFESGGVLHNVADPVGWAARFLDAVHNLTAVRPLLYINRDVLHRFDWRRVVAGNYGLWLADWASPVAPQHIGPWPFVALWQSGDGNGQLDADTFFGSRAAWLAYGGAGGHVYVVREGDTLSKIAAELGTTVPRLASVNHLADPNLIYPGQHLTY